LAAAFRILGLAGIPGHARWPDRPRTSARPVEWHLGALCTIVVLPLLGFVGLLLWQYTGAERLRLRQQGADLLHAVTVAVERDLAAQGAMVELAAHSPALLSEDLPSIRRAMGELAGALDIRIALATPAGEALFDSAGGMGPSLARADDRPARAGRRPVVSDLLVDPAWPEPLVAITAPVIRPGTNDVVYLLRFGFAPHRLSQAVVREGARPGALALVLDGRGHAVASSAEDAVRVGQSLPAIAARLAGGSGRLQVEIPDRARFESQYRRLDGADWTVVAGLDEAVLAAPMRRFLIEIGGLGLAACLFSLALALIFGSRIATTIADLRAAAAALEAGQPVTFGDTSVAQVNEAGRALASAADAIGRSRTQQALLNRELHHRVKNNLATVQAVVASVARSSDSLESFRTSISDRLRSLAKTHDLLIASGWQSASLMDILESELQPYRADGLQRVELLGPAVQLPSDAALPVAMLIHELVTNAAKYGALSVPAGRLVVAWTLSQGGRGPELALTWTEAGGPPVRPPARAGFGSKLMDRIGRQLDGAVEREFAAEG
jgi:two-component sensor histidine kinase